MRGFREIRTSERIERERKEKEKLGYLQIKPETDITVEEAQAYILQIFEQAALETAQES